MNDDDGKTVGEVIAEGCDRQVLISARFLTLTGIDMSKPYDEMEWIELAASLSLAAHGRFTVEEILGSMYLLNRLVEVFCDDD